MLTQPPTWAFKMAKTSLHSHLALKIPFALFSPIFPPCQEEKFYLSRFPLSINVNIAWEFSESSLEAFIQDVSIRPVRGSSRECDC